jgi:hypothetical protein
VSSDVGVRLAPLGLLFAFAACRQVLGVDDADTRDAPAPKMTGGSAGGRGGSGGHCGGGGSGGSAVSSSSSAAGGAMATSSSSGVGGAGGASEFVPCGGKCVDYESDASNCGACGGKCTGGEACVTGVCGHRLQSMPSAYSPLPSFP